MCSGMCVAEPVQVSVSLLLSVDIPLPYQVVRGEQLELAGSVYNQKANSISVPTTHHLHYISHNALSLQGAVVMECLVKCLDVVVSSSVLCDADSRTSDLSAPVPGNHRGGRAAVHALHLDPSVCGGGGQGDLHPAEPGAWRTHPDLHPEVTARRQGRPAEEAPSGGWYLGG